ncbi:MAG: thiamine pyrophosphate-binding protein [Rhodospirillales bacterium]|nr:thiamine pyrophosphate-binding protein [Rhodospirillales bacterium]
MASSIEARDISRRRGAGAQLRREEDPASRAFTGGDALVKTLLDHGVDTAFGVPGESYLAVLEALRGAQDRLRFVVTRHESGATFAACAYGRLAQKPGVAFVTRGPGATNGAIGIHTARQDSVPLLLFIGQVPSGQRGREAFQEIDYHRMLGPLTKAVFEPQTPQEVADAAAEAHAIAMDGRPGPVAVSLPEDVTEGAAGNAPPPELRTRSPRRPAPEAVDDIARRLAQAERPVVLAGEMVGFEGANAALAAFAEAHGVGVLSSFRQQGVVPCAHPAYLGTLGLALPPYQETLLAEADLVLALGTRLDLATTVDDRVTEEARFVIHVYPDGDALAAAGGDLQVCADVMPVLEGLIAAAPEAPPAPRSAWRAAQRAAFDAFRQKVAAPALGAVDLAAVVQTLTEQVPADATIVNDAGNFSTWLLRHYPYEHPLSQAAPAVGAMGYAMPGAIGAQLARPGKRVVALAGDGGFGMTGQELITAVGNRLPIVVLVCDNGGYGTIAMHQHTRYGAGATYGIALDRPDFAAAARAWGADAWTVAATEEFAPALEGALAADGPTLIHLITDMRDLAASGVKMQ